MSLLTESATFHMWRGSLITFIVGGGRAIWWCHCKWRFTGEADQSWDSFFVPGAVCGEVAKQNESHDWYWHLFSLGIYSLSIYSLCIYSFGAYSLSIYSLSIYSLGIYSLSIYSLSIYSLGMYSLSIYSLSIYSLSCLKLRNSEVSHPNFLW